MSRVTETFCDYCNKSIKTKRSGGSRPTVVDAVYWITAEIYVVKNTRGDRYDFCSRECLELGDF